MNPVLALPVSADGPDAIDVALGSIRRHLGMAVAYVSEFVGDRMVFRAVDAPGLEALVKPGDTRSLDDVYCRHILEGRLPELMADTADHALAVSMPITQAVPIGAHMSVPIRLPDGRPYGMFCCLSPVADPSLTARDLAVMRVFAEMAASQIAMRIERERADGAVRERIERVLAEEAFATVLQPIRACGDDAVLGFEALTRFAHAPVRTPDLWFDEAARVGLGVALEMAALRRALRLLDGVAGTRYLSLNVSPATLLDPDLQLALDGAACERVVIELTEHTAIDDYPSLARAIASLRARGVRLAVDDAGAGYASFQHILRLAPDIIKLDMQLTRNVDGDPARRALVAAMLRFAGETGAIVVAEGVETPAEWATLQALGVHAGQGYLLGRPAAPDAWIADRAIALPQA